MTLSLDLPKFNQRQAIPIHPNLPPTMASEVEEESLDLFQEPVDFYEPEKQATFASHQLLSGKELKVRLVGHNPLWVRLHLPKHLSKSVGPH